MTSTNQTALLALETFLTSHPGIKYTPPSDPSFNSLAKVFVRSRPHTPLAIVQPQTPSDVAALIKLAKNNSIPFTIRSGGHNLEGRAVANDALLIDLRALNSVSVSPDRKTATVGGGILQYELGAQLWEHGLATATGAIPDVGYAGWAMYGGYGAFSSHWGLGVDQIVGARVVDSQGELVDADEELLTGIRGAGGVFGVVVELVVRVYPLTGFLAGPIVFDSSDIESSFVAFNAAYNALCASESLPSQLTLQRLVFNMPNPTGRTLTFGVSFVWSGSVSQLEEGQHWIQKISNLGPAILNAVTPTSVPLWSASNGNLPKALYGSSHTHNLSSISDKLARVIGRNLALMPSDPGAMFSIHQLRGDSPSASPQSQGNVFVTRQPHYMLEVLGFATSEDLLPESKRWAERMANEIENAEPESVLPTVYLSLWDSASAKGADEALEKVYGEKAGLVRALKRRVDAGNLFRLAVPAVE
ncbi:FAD-binding oxidoreductase [Aspergillus mulundensis]|uniref:FAD-binding PCMH-type domain-containing protein n=1 Tax=Aspergillus mulundensis TaxID=1810919 RepID=A0A3D8SUS2_9EURO|nr:Uncharacterized protein DSM5745_01815 [Aspergillus mulundensis]RDW90040.1 Uncharacterized protein DSM5745_01815 [Aspergillus mulundensis]